jgi:hypothetical protein
VGIEIGTSMVTRAIGLAGAGAVGGGAALASRGENEPSDKGTRTVAQAAQAAPAAPAAPEKLTQPRGS